MRQQYQLSQRLAYRRKPGTQAAWFTVFAGMMMTWPCPAMRVSLWRLVQERRASMHCCAGSIRQPGLRRQLVREWKCERCRRSAYGAGRIVKCGGARFVFRGERQQGGFRSLVKNVSGKPPTPRSLRHQKGPVVHGLLVWLSCQLCGARGTGRALTWIRSRCRPLACRACETGRSLWHAISAPRHYPSRRNSRAPVAATSAIQPGGSSVVASSCVTIAGPARRSPLPRPARR